MRGIVLTLDGLIDVLTGYWRNQGCTVLPAYDMEVGAGTMSPYTFFQVLADKPVSLCYVQPSRRPTDGRYGENPNRVFKHHQLQVIIKPSPKEIQHLYLQSLQAVGIQIQQHDIRFIEDNWESPALGAWGVGWEVWLDGMEITQFTYFQQCGGIELSLPSVEITYGLERIALYIQEKNSVYDLQFGTNALYGTLRLQEEQEQSKYCHELANQIRLIQLFQLYYEESEYCLEKLLVLPAYDYALKCSHVFNILDSLGALSVTERTRYLGQVRKLANQAAKLYIQIQKEIP